MTFYFPFQEDALIYSKLVSSDDDIVITTRLAHQIWHEYFSPIIGKKQVEYMLDKFQSEQEIKKQIKNGYLYYALLSDTRQIGYIALRLDDDALFLSKLYLLKEFRGKGLSHFMFEIAEKIARQHDKKIIRLTCNKNNLSSLAVYEKKGYIIKKAEKTDIGNGFFMDDYILEKTI